MASIVDEMMCREGQIDEDFLGLNRAFAGAFSFERERGESEEEFLTRARKDAALLGYRNLFISGCIEVGNSLSAAPSPKPGAAVSAANLEGG